MPKKKITKRSPQSATSVVKHEISNKQLAKLLDDLELLCSPPRRGDSCIVDQFLMKDDKEYSGCIAEYVSIPEAQLRQKSGTLSYLQRSPYQNVYIIPHPDKYVNLSRDCSLSGRIVDPVIS